MKLFFKLILFSITFNIFSNTKFVIIIPSYNNEKWCDRNIKSVIDQDYDNFRVVFVDDCSKDRTFDIVQSIVCSSNISEKFTLIKNDTRHGALFNIYQSVHLCSDNEVVVTLDGDDWFSNSLVLDKLDKAYSSKDVWLTFGQFEYYAPFDMSMHGSQGTAYDPPCENVFNRDYRCLSPFFATHLRTFKASLFKKIKLEDLLFGQSQFFEMAWDLSFMYPMLEMAGNRIKYIDDILYIYNIENPINDFKVSLERQHFFSRFVQAKEKYSEILDEQFLNTDILGNMIVEKFDNNTIIYFEVFSDKKFITSNGLYNEIRSDICGICQAIIKTGVNVFIKEGQIDKYLFNLKFPKKLNFKFGLSILDEIDLSKMLVSLDFYYNSENKKNVIMFSN